jgi:hypothetical protein
MSAVPSLFVPKDKAKQATALIQKKTGQTVRDGKCLHRLIDTACNNILLYRGGATIKE